MLKDSFVRVMLALIAVLLLLNLLGLPAGPLFPRRSTAETGSQSINFGCRTGSSITCSSDGKYVYAADGCSIYRSADYGKNGSWEEVAH